MAGTTYSRLDDISDIGFSPSEDDFETEPNDESTDSTTNTAESYGSSRPTSKDYWFGKKYFYCVLSQNLVDSTANDEPIQRLDTALATAIQSFNYAEFVNTIRAQSVIFGPMSVPSSGIPDFETSVSLMGSIIRLGDARERNALLQAVHRYQLGTPPSSLNGDSTKRPNSEYTTPHTPRRPPPVRPNPGYNVTHTIMRPPPDVMAQMASEAMKLKEYGDQMGIVSEKPTYTTVSSNPPDFIAHQPFDGINYDGRSSTKKFARHLAAHNACLALGLS